MKNLIMKFQNFMRDRYARVDSICLACLIANLVLDITAGFFRSNLAVWWVLSVLSVSLVVYAVYRPFSKNIWKRDSENRRFKSFLAKIKSELTLFFRRIKYGKVSVFRKCPRCKAVIRFPRKKGEHRAKCPACGEKFRVKVIF